MQAVRFDDYGDVSVLELREVEDPVAGIGEVLVRVKATAINPGEAAIREGALAQQFPTTFPSGEGSDFSGEVAGLGLGVEAFAVGDAVLGWSDERASHAELVVVPQGQLVPKPDGLSWEVAGALFVAPLAAYACVEAVAPRAGETVVVSGAAGGVGGIAVQLAKRSGATVLGLASEANHAWLQERGVVPVAYGDGQAERLRDAAPDGIDAWIDVFGGGYADLAIELGVPTARINTIIDFSAVERLGILAQGTSQVREPAVAIAELAGLAAAGELEIPIATTFPLRAVRAAYTELAERHTRGKIVLLP